jgi:hypothetical protein
MSSSLAKSGLFAKAEGKAALKEWPVIIAADSPMTGCSRVYRVEFSRVEFKNFPEFRVKTGLSFLLKSAIFLIFLRH